ncbi:USP6 N-terminal-like protein [Canis lupus baileyi]|uniref:USP6 N-terminal-like protein n=1 Tax=Canis lupus baileyi TaxID=143281 RepID=UPI0003AE281E|eukprot:XP_022270702.1 USP6 N-terminal-like protein [Canis lupus familiaris]
MLKRWDHYLPSEKLRRTAPGLQGGPPQVRGQVWLRLLNVDQVKAGNAGKYQEMKEAALVSSRDIMQIDLDVNRTFRSHTMFWDRYGVRQRALFQVLSAYSVYDTVSVPAPASCPAGGLVLSAGDQWDSQLGPQLHGPEMPGRVSLLRDGQGAGCRPPRGGRACVPKGRDCPGPPRAPRPS